MPTALDDLPSVVPQVLEARMNKISPRPKCVLCYSGGLDSTVLLYSLIARDGYDVHCLAVYYNQKHATELSCAAYIAAMLKVKYYELDLRSLKYIMSGSSQTDSEISVPDGHYTDESMKVTVVPNRNMILLSLATAWAISLKAKAVVYAAHAGDHTIYPDCRKEFVVAMREAMSLCDWNPPRLNAPFRDMTKADIVKIGAELGVPFEKTYSCYKGGAKHCGRCGTCCERRLSFKHAGVTDPTEYEDMTFTDQFKE